MTASTRGAVPTTHTKITNVMFCKYNHVSYFLTFVFASCASTGAFAQQVCANCGACPGVVQMGTPPPGKPRSIPHTDSRAGFPRCISKHAMTARDEAIVGYAVGGGQVHGGLAPNSEQGTWGWDDTGRVRHRPRVALGWHRSRRAQGGAGAYKTDGPHVPDIPAALAAKHVAESR